MNVSRQLTTADKAMMAGLFWQGWCINGRPATWHDMTPQEQSRSEMEWNHFVVKPSEAALSVDRNAPKRSSTTRNDASGYPTKYSEDQARDDHGRWTSGGGSDELRYEDVQGGTESVAAQQMNKLSDHIEKYGSSPQMAKRFVQMKIEKQAAKNPDWKALSEAYKEHGLGKSSKSLARDLVATWAGTSGDSDETAVLMQHMANEEFKLSGADTGHFWHGGSGHSRDTLLSDAASSFGVTYGHSKEEAAGITERGLKAFLRAQYDLAQKDLARQGIKDVYLTRGMSLQEYAGKLEPDRVTLSLQPMSSFSSHVSIASNFGNSLFLTRVPATRILAIPRCGYGCQHEREVVVLGGTLDAIRSYGYAGGGKIFGDAERMLKPPEPAHGKSFAMVTKAARPVIHVDDDLGNADWAKTTWDLPPYRSVEFNDAFPDLDKFKELPVYKEAVKAGLIVHDRWAGPVDKDDVFEAGNEPVASASKGAVYLAKYSDEQPRVPAGSPEGGQFGGGGGEAGGVVSAALFERAKGGSKFSQLNDKINEALGEANHYNDDFDEQKRVSDALADKLNSDEDWHKAFPLADQSKDAVHRIVSGWAATSGDGRPLPIALQLVAKEEFGLDSAPVSHMVGDSKQTDYIWEAMQRTAPFIGMPTDLAKGALHAYTRAEYNNTQAWLRDKGITEVAVFRGVNLAGEEKPDKDYAAREASLQPLSSFSASKGVAFNNFAVSSDSRVLATVFPAKSIISTCRTGRGTWGESEVVALGRPTRAVFMNRFKTPTATQVDWGGSKALVTKKASEVSLDSELENADWPKATWALPPYKSAAFNDLIPDLDNFRKLPVYKFAVKAGLIVNDTWVGKGQTK